MLDYKRIIPKSKRGIFIALLLVEAIAFTKVLGYKTLLGMHLIDTYGLITWLISYDFGFIKRGLLGTLSSPLNAAIGHTESVILLSVLAALILSVITALFGAHFICKLRGHFISWVISVLFIMLPGGIGNFYYNLSYQDAFLIISIFLLLYLIYFVKYYQIYTVMLFTASVLIHEIYIFLFLPIIISFCILIKEYSPTVILPSVILPSIAIVASVLYLGVPDTSTDQLANIIKEKVISEKILSQQETIHNPSLFKNFSSIFTRSLYENFQIFVIGIGQLHRYLACLIMTTPIIFLFALFHKSLSLKERWILACGGSFPLMLGFISIDIGRWVSFSTVVFLILLSITIIKRPEISKMTIKNLEPYKLYIISPFLGFISGSAYCPVVFMIASRFNIPL